MNGTMDDKSPSHMYDSDGEESCSSSILTGGHQTPPTMPNGGTTTANSTQGSHQLGNETTSPQQNIEAVYIKSESSGAYGHHHPHHLMGHHHSQHHNLHQLSHHQLMHGGSESASGESSANKSGGYNSQLHEGQSAALGINAIVTPPNSISPAALSPSSNIGSTTPMLVGPAAHFQAHHPHPALNSQPHPLSLYHHQHAAANEWYHHHHPPPSPNTSNTSGDAMTHLNHFSHHHHLMHPGAAAAY